jgi:hypothetical protein
MSAPAVVGVVFVVGADHWPRAYLRAELIERGWDAVGFVALRDCLSRLIAAPLPRPRAIVVDLAGEDADDRLLAAVFRKGIPMIAVAGAEQASSSRLRRLPWAVFLRRPVTIGAIADVVAQVPGGAAPS